MAFTKILGPGIATDADVQLDDIFAGIITATRFEGDGSQLSGLPGGLGTALSTDSTSALSAIYTNDRILSIGATITVDVPDSSAGAYTQYTDIVVEADADLIVADGDDFIPDILGLSVPGSAELLPGAGGRVRADQFTNKAGTGAPNFPNGATFDGNVSIAATLTYEDVTSIDSIGIVTARSGVEILSGDLIIPDSIIHGGDTNTKLRFPAADTFTIETAGEERFRLTSSGNVGIGTDTVFGKLQVHAGVDANFSFSTGGGEASLELINNAGSANVPLNIRASEYKIKIGGTEKFRIGSSGQLGIEGANYGSAGQVLTSGGASAAPTWAFANTFSFFVEQDNSTVQTVTTNQYTRLTGYRTITNNSMAIATGTSSVATWNSTDGTLTIGADGGGLWYFAMMAGIDDIQAGDYVQVVIGKNGDATDVGTRLSNYGRSWSSNNANIVVVAQTFSIASCSPNDVVSAYVYHNESTNEQTEQNRCHFMGYKLSALT